MHRSPKRQALIAFTFLSGKGFIDIIKPTLLDAEVPITATGLSATVTIHFIPGDVSQPCNAFQTEARFRPAMIRAASRSSVRADPNRVRGKPCHLDNSSLMSAINQSASASLGAKRLLDFLTAANEVAVSVDNHEFAHPPRLVSCGLKSGNPILGQPERRNLSRECIDVARAQIGATIIRRGVELRMQEKMKSRPLRAS